MSDSDRPIRPGELARHLKQHSNIQVFVACDVEVYGAPLEDGYSGLLGVNNIEFLGSIDRLAEVVDAMSQLAHTMRDDPELMARWRDGGRLGHPLLVSLPRRDDTGASSATSEGLPA